MRLFATLVQILRQEAGRVARFGSSRWALFVTVSLVCAGLAAMSANAHAAGTKWHITVGTGIDASYAQDLVAVQKGFFKKYGIDATLKTFQSGNDALDGLIAGDVDVSGSSETGGIVRFAKGAKIYNAGLAAWSTKQVGIVGTAAINRPTDLYGKTVGFQVGSAGDFYFHRYVAKYKLDSSKIKTANLQPPDAIAALSRGDIQAYFLWQPWLDNGISTVNGSHIVAYSGQDNVFLATSYIYYGQRIVSNKPLAIATTKALVAACQWIESHKADAAQIVSQAYHISTADAAKFITNFSYAPRWTKTDLATVVNNAHFALNSHLITLLPDIRPYIRPEFLKAVSPKRVSAGK
jgi:ABC-type nitrate/sulfonate/bicarbonate transport system substrate-binding protein